MKKNLTISIILTISLLGFSSCKGFLDLLPTQSVPSPESVTNVNDAQTALNGVYRQMTSSYYYGRDMFLYAEFKGGDFGLTTTAIAGDDMYYFTHTASSGTRFAFWTTIYDVILQANNILGNVENGKVEPATSAEEANLNHIVGQALTIRALCLFDLTRLYGLPYTKDNGAGWGAPIVTKVLSAQDKLQRNTVKECYDQIIADLTKAIPLMKSTKTTGYFNKSGAQALLSRVYLYKGDWENAYLMAKEVIENGGYSAYTADNWVESWKKQGGTESIFEIYKVPLESDNGSSSMASYFAPRNTTEKWLGPMMVSDNFLEMFSQSVHLTDTRWNIFDFDEFGNGRNAPDRQIPERKGWMKKYYGDGKSTITATNNKVIRLSEVLLIGAEAALKKSSADKDNAVKWINIIRGRNPELTDLTTSETNENLLKEIELQRRIELIGEGHRFFDVIRNNGTIYFTDGGFWNAIPNGGRGESIDWNYGKIVLPIGIDEINANPDIAAQQNEAYK